MKGALVTVGVPVYNAAPYLERCVGGILSQTYENLDVILVDDGSTDESLSICRRCAAMDARVRVLHQENAGQGSARNRVLQDAKGEWLCFVDADDLVTPHYAEYLLSIREQTGADIAVCGICYAYEGETPRAVNDVDGVQLLDRERALNALLYQTLFDASPCAKLLPVDIARAHAFPEGRIYEDLATAYLWLAQAEMVAFGGRQPYVYMQRRGSTMTQSFSERKLEQLTACDELYAYIGAHVPACLPAARARRFSGYCQTLLSMPSDKQLFPDRREQMNTVLKTDAPLVMADRNCRKKNRAAAFVYQLAGEPGLRLLWRAVKR